MSIITSLSWYRQLIHATKKRRHQFVDLVLEGLKVFKNGKPNKAGQDFVKMLKKDCELIGFTPNVFYIKAGKKNGRDYAADMKTQWVHPFGSHTLLYKHKKLPFLIITNQNLKLDDSRLSDISENTSLSELQDILGITG